MKFVIAPDSYKGCMRSIEICEKLEAGIRAVLPDAEVIKMPMADGGEGTVEAVVYSTGGKFHKVQAAGPLGGTVEAMYGTAGNSDTAVMEMASASGIELVPREELDPMLATTYGTGEVLRNIIENGIRDIIIGIGGSATVDGGAGMAQALGYKFLDSNGNELPQKIGGGMLDRIASVDTSNVIPELKECCIRIASDVTNPLLGNNGAAKVFGPQKGATPEKVEILEAKLKHYSEIIIASGLADSCFNPGDGAAGGLGFGLRALCGAESVSGAGLLIEITEMDKVLDRADVLITGEGCTDSQTANGKLCAVIAETAAKHDVPAILVSGALKGDLSGLDKLFAAMFSTTVLPCSLDEALEATSANLVRMGRSIAGVMSI